MTLTGTNTYVVDAAPCWVIDPGPRAESHLAAIADATSSRGGIAGILLTHSHADHSAAAEELDAPILCGEPDPMLESDWAAAALAGATGPLPRQDPPAERSEPKRVTAIGPFEVIPTPGHAKDHVCLLHDTVLFCGDLILGEGSTIVPPRALRGSLADYMASLERIAGLDVELLAPGHGPWITDPEAKVAEYLSHRREREERLAAALAGGELSRQRLLAQVWDDVPEVLRPAAALAMEAHLEKLQEEGRAPAELAP